MQEQFLHFIWQYQYFKKDHLFTHTHEKINILYPGNLNDNAGPDFGFARLYLGNLKWYGDVEIHIKSSDWNQHKHQEDPAYDNVILHVVWENDKSVNRSDGTLIPILELKNLVDTQLLHRYQELLEARQTHLIEQNIPCANVIQNVKPITKLSMLDKVVTQRLEKKAGEVQWLLEQNNRNWEITAYNLLAKNFGFKVNSDPFLRLSQALPFKIAAKHSHSLFQLEALLFGQAGFLEANIQEQYICDLQQEYRFFVKKFNLQKKGLSRDQWKFSRLRPANFPTLRIAQFAALFHHHQNLFAFFSQTKDFKTMVKGLKIPASHYWQNHYHFGNQMGTNKPVVKKLGQKSIENIIINTTVPLLAAMGLERDDTSYIDRAINYLQHLPPEKNKILDQWKNLSIPVKSAFDSQALIELYNNYCARRKCLQCNIGVSIMNQPV